MGRNAVLQDPLTTAKFINQVISLSAQDRISEASVANLELIKSLPTILKQQNTLNRLDRGRGGGRGIGAPTITSDFYDYGQGGPLYRHATVVN